MATHNKVKISEGVVWAYLGPEASPPPLPQLEWNLVPADQRYVTKRVQFNNWFQALEGGIDSSHVSFLHSGELNRDPLFKGSYPQDVIDDLGEAAPRVQPGLQADRAFR